MKKVQFYISLPYVATNKEFLFEISPKTCVIWKLFPFFRLFVRNSRTY